MFFDLSIPMVIVGVAVVVMIVNITQYSRVRQQAAKQQRTVQDIHADAREIQQHSFEILDRQAKLLDVLERLLHRAEVLLARVERTLPPDPTKTQVRSDDERRS
jgi:uncharacterized protein YoxC